MLFMHSWYCSFSVQVDQSGVQEATSKYEIRQAGQFDNHNSQVSWNISITLSFLVQAVL